MGQSCSKFICSITGVGERLLKVLGLIESKLWFPWQPKSPTDLQWRKWCHSFFISFSSNLQVIRTGIKSRASSDQIRHCPLEPLWDSWQAYNLGGVLIPARSDYSLWSYCPLVLKNLIFILVWSVVRLLSFGTLWNVSDRVGRWCWIASSAGASYYFCIW